MDEIDTRIIDGVAFSVAPFSFWETQKLQHRVLKILTPVLGQLAGSIKELKKGEFNWNEVDLGGDMIAKAATLLFDSLPVLEYQKLIERILKNTAAEITDKDENRKNIQLDSEAAFNIIFQRKQLMLYKVIAFVAEVNFPDFFSGMGDIGSRMKEAFTSSVLGENKTSGLKD